MRELRHCKQCHEPIVWDDEIIRTDDGDLYHENCCSIFPIRYGVMVDSEYKGNTDDSTQIACLMLDDGEYIDIEESEAE